MSPRLRVALALTLAAAAALLGLHLAGLETGLLFLTPAFALTLPLLAGRYPGERAIARAGLRPTRCRAPRRTALRPPARLLPRGGLLVGHALAGRAPPA